MRMTRSVMWNDIRNRESPRLVADATIIMSIVFVLGRLPVRELLSLSLYADMVWQTYRAKTQMKFSKSSTEYDNPIWDARIAILVLREISFRARLIV